MRTRPRPIVLILIAAAIAAAVAVGAVLLSPSHGSSLAGSSASSEFDGAALPAPQPAHQFTLDDQTGRPVSLAAYRGRVTVLAFLDSTCGPACVLVAQQIRGALDELGSPVPVLLLSADPAADTPAHVSRFLAETSLAGRVRYLSGAPAALRPLWRAYRVVLPAAGRADFDRSLSVLLLDRDGRERVVFGLEQLTPEGLAHDIRKLS